MSLQPETEHMIEQFQAIVRRQAVEMLDVDDDRAALLADEAATRFFDEFGGSMHYLPKGRVFRSSKLHSEVWNAFNGSNARDLQTLFKISLQYIYQIIKRERARDTATRQAPLPGLDQRP